MNYHYFKGNYKIIAIELSKQQALVADPLAIQHINFIKNFDLAGNTTIFFIYEEANEILLDFSQRNVEVL